MSHEPWCQSVRHPDPNVEWCDCGTFSRPAVLPFPPADFVPQTEVERTLLRQRDEWKRLAAVAARERKEAEMATLEWQKMHQEALAENARLKDILRGDFLDRWQASVAEREERLRSAGGPVPETQP